MAMLREPKSLIMPLHGRKKPATVASADTSGTFGDSSVIAISKTRVSSVGSSRTVNFLTTIGTPSAESPSPSYSENALSSRV